MVVVCNEKDLLGFTYGRIYVFIGDPNLYVGRNWIKNDQGFTVAERKDFFKTLPDWKKHINKVK